LIKNLTLADNSLSTARCKAVIPAGFLVKIEN